MAGAPGLSAPGGVQAAIDRIREAAAALPPLRAVICVGAAGALAAPDAAGELAHRLISDLGYAGAIVTSDVVTAHLGALSGGPGVVVVAGTGAVALAVGSTGELTVVDGAGPMHGDLGGGGWIGAEALRLATRDGGALAVAAEEVLGSQWQDAGSEKGPGAAGLRGRLVPRVGELARGGDHTAYDLVVRSATAIAGTARRAVESLDGDDPVDVCIVGGVREIGPPWTTVLTERLSETPRVRLREPHGDALDGAAILVDRTDLPHEQHVHRVAGTDSEGCPP